MKIGVVLPTGSTDGPAGGVATWRDILAIARTAEDAGLDSAWAADHFLHRSTDGEESGIHEVWTVLSGVAAATSRIELGPIVLCSSFRSPGMTAKMAAALDLVSEGRLILGVGCGWHDAEYEAFGIPTDHRVGRFEEWLDILAPLLRGERVTFSGTYYETKDAALLPPPERRIPLLIAAKRPRMLELTARQADAWNTAWYPGVTDRLTSSLAALEAAMAAQGRPNHEVERTVGISVRDRSQALVPEPEPDDAAIEGDVDELARSLEAFARLGVGHVIASLEPSSVRSVERLAEAARLVGDR